MSTPRICCHHSARSASRASGFTLVLISFLLGACTSAPSRVENAPTESERLVSADFASAISQIVGLEPEQTTLHMDATTLQQDTFGVAFRDALQRRGYAVRTATPHPGDQEVGFSVADTVKSDSGRTLMYEVSVGSVGLRRSYLPTETGRIRPAATMLVKGADATGIQLNDALFDGAGALPPTNDAPVEVAPIPIERQTTPALVTEADLAPESQDPVQITPVERAAYAEGTPLQAPSQAPSQASARAPAQAPGLAANAGTDYVQQPLTSIAAPTITRSIPAERPTLDSLARLTRDDKQNFRTIGGSNFADVLQDYQLVRESVLVFGDDSLRLGNENKWLIQGIVENFNPESDVFSVIGCSNGSTKYAGGNAGLALERAARVVEALLYAGVPKEKVLDEGCWSGETFTQMPSRGVVVALKRLAS